MADSPIGRPEPLIAAAVASNRIGPAPERQKRREPEERKNGGGKKNRQTEEPINARRRRLFDLLFFEIDRVPDIAAGQKARLKENLRAHIERRSSEHPGTLPTPEEIDALLDASENPDDHPNLTVEPEAILKAALPEEPAATKTEADENARLAAQFRACLELDTAVARKVALYLKLLVRLAGLMSPHFTVDV